MLVVWSCSKYGRYSVGDILAVSSECSDYISNPPMELCTGNSRLGDIVHTRYTYRHSPTDDYSSMDVRSLGKIYNWVVGRLDLTR